MPEETKALFDKTFDTGIEHGTITVLLNHEGYEVTTYRIDGKYEDSRHPKEVTFTRNLKEDLLRRDFTINAMAYNDKDGIVDIFGGMQDLEKHMIRCVGNARERFSEDALRILRGVRFAAQLGFEIEKETRQAIRKLAPNLSYISAERIQTELVKLLVSDHPEKIRDAYELGITKVILPEFDAMMETTQETLHHCYNVGEHTIHALMNIPADKVLRLTMLLHDVAKPVCRTEDENGIHHFHGHPQVGAEMSRKILRRLKFDNDTIHRVMALVRAHDDRPPLQGRSVRRAIYRNGTEQYPELFEVKRADILAQSSFLQQEKLLYVDRYEHMYQQIMEMKKAGNAILMISEELTELIGMSDRLLIMKDFEISGQFKRSSGLKPADMINYMV